MECYLYFGDADSYTSGPQVYIYGVKGAFEYHVDLLVNNQRHYINDSLVYETSFNTLTIKGINLYCPDSLRKSYYDNIKLNNGTYNVVDIDIQDYAMWKDQSVINIPNFPLTPWNSGSLDNTFIIEEPEP